MTEATALARVAELAAAHGLHAASGQCADPARSPGLSPAGDAAVAHAAVGGAWVAAGAPLCEPRRLLPVAHSFERAAAAAGARAVWFLAEEPMVRAATDGEFVRVGAQPVFVPEDLAAVFGRRPGLRMQLRRASRRGVRIRPLDGPHDPAAASLPAIQAQWLATRRSPPLQLLAGPSTKGAWARRRVLVAEREGRVVAYLLLLPVPARRGWLVEQIARGPFAGNGTGEALLHAAAQLLAAEGAQMISLGCVPLARCAPPDRRAHALCFAALRTLASPFYGFAGLEAWKRKFQPAAWEPLYVGRCGGPLRLRDCWAIVAAQAGGRPLGFATAAALRRLGLSGPRPSRSPRPDQPLRAPGSPPACAAPPPTAACTTATAAAPCRS